MHIKFVSLFAAAVLLAACETAPEDSGQSSGSGATVQSATTPSTAAAPAQSVSVKPAPGSAEEFVVEVGDRVYFGFDSSELNAEARTTLERQAFWLRRYPSVTIQIEGHCDERGTREYNLALGERRANAAKDYLVALGIDTSRLSTISYGKERAVAFGSNDEAWSLNRRGVTKIN
jgi:peptidoglycan-associated lipoprotein